MLYTTPKKGTFFIRIFNLVGQQIISHKGRGYGFFIDYYSLTLSSGVYIAQITQGGQQATHKFVIIK